MNMRVARRVILCLAALVAAMGPPPARVQAQTPSAVRTWQDTLTLPTCKEGLADPNPPFDLFTSGDYRGAQDILRSMPQPVEDLSFTRDALAAILTTPSVRDRVQAVERVCNP